MEWLNIMVLGVLIAVVLVGAPVVWLYGRRRWLSRSGGLFDCSMRSVDAASSTGWVLGAARYSGEYLEIFRIFGLSFAPTWQLRRRSIEALGSRIPDDSEATVLFEGQHVARLRVDDRQWEIAMDPESLTGLLSWLEAAPPGPESDN